jgi:hypothetical protein
MSNLYVFERLIFRVPLLVCGALAASLVGCYAGTGNLAPATRAPSATQPAGKAIPWGIKYQEIAFAFAQAEQHYPGMSAEGGFCSNGGIGYHCAPVPVMAPSATAPPLSVKATQDFQRLHIATAAAEGDGSTALGSSMADLSAQSSLASGYAAHAEGTQLFGWFDEVLSPRATRKHPKGTPIALTATLIANGRTTNLDCAYANYFVALATAPNLPQLNQPGGCPGQAPGSPLGTATWTTSYGATPMPISGELDVYVEAFGNGESPNFSGIQTTFHLDPPAGVHYKTASGKCYSSTGVC